MALPPRGDHRGAPGSPADGDGGETPPVTAPPVYVGNEEAECASIKEMSQAQIDAALAEITGHCLVDCELSLAVYVKRLSDLSDAFSTLAERAHVRAVNAPRLA